MRALSALKRRSPEQPIALVAASVEALAELIPELPARPVLRAPHARVSESGAATPWLAGARPDTIGVRIPDLAGPAPRFSAGRRRRGDEREPARRRRSASLADVPSEILDGVAAVLDVGELPGTPSTVLDLTGPEPRVLREGAVPAARGSRSGREATRQ